MSTNNNHQLAKKSGISTPESYEILKSNQVDLHLVTKIKEEGLKEIGILDQIECEAIFKFAKDLREQLLR